MQTIKWEDGKGVDKLRKNSLHSILVAVDIIDVAAREINDGDNSEKILFALRGLLDEWSTVDYTIAEWGKERQMELFDDLAEKEGGNDV